jgi:CDGSH-type Zn-finger protein
MMVMVREEKTVAWCACTRTSTIPGCDGSHAKLK